MYVCMYVGPFSIITVLYSPNHCLPVCCFPITISHTVLTVMLSPLQKYESKTCIALLFATKAHSLYVFMYISGIPLPILQTLMSAQMGQTIVSIPAPTHLAPLCVAVTLALRWMPMESTAQVGAWPSSQSMLPPR